MSVLRVYSKNISFVLWTRILSACVNLTFLAVASRTFGVVYFGKLVFVLATISFMEMAFCGSADSILVREQAKDASRSEENVGACFLIHSTFAALIVLVTSGLAFHWRADPVLFKGLMLGGWASAFQVLFVVPVAFFRARQDMGFEARLITGERILFVGGFLAIVKMHGGIPSVLGCLMVSMGLKSLAGYIWFFRRMPRFQLRPGLGKLGYFWLESIPMIGVALFISVHSRIDLFFMKALSTAEQLGIYAASFRAIEMIRVLPVDVITAAFPIFCAVAGTRREDGTDERFQKMYGIFVRLGLVVSVMVTAGGIFYAAHGSRALFGNGFGQTIWPIRILLMAFPLMFWSQINNITLTAIHKQRFMWYALVVVVVCQGVSDYLLISRQGATGAAASYLLGEAVLLLATLTALQHSSISVRATTRSASKVLLALIVALAIVYPFRAMILSVEVAILALCFIAAVILMRVFSKAEAFALFSALRGRRDSLEAITSPLGPALDPEVSVLAEK